MRVEMYLIKAEAEAMSAGGNTLVVLLTHTE